MPYEVRITGVPLDKTSPIWVVDGIEYKYALMDDKRFRLSVGPTLYADYIGVFNVEEAIEIDRTYGLVPLTARGHKANAKLYDHMKKDAPNTRWIIIEMYEVD